MPSPLLIEEGDVYAFFGRSSAASGDDYQKSGRVLTAILELEGLLLSGLVRGSADKPYQVSIKFSQDGDIAAAQKDCTCPIGGRCKHAAALLLEHIRTSESTALSLSSNLSQPVQEWLALLLGGLEKCQAQKSEQGAVLYVLNNHNGRLELQTLHGVIADDGLWCPSHKVQLSLVASRSLTYVSEVDSEIAKLFLAGRSSENWFQRNYFPTHPRLASMLLREILLTGRAFYADLKAAPLRLAAPATGFLQWQDRQDGSQKLAVAIDDFVPERDQIVIAGGAWYYRGDLGEMGEIRLPVPDEIERAILLSPAIEPEDAAELARLLSVQPLQSVLPAPRIFKIGAAVEADPLPVLTLITRGALERQYDAKDWPGKSDQCLVVLRFDNGGKKFNRQTGTMRRELVDDEVRVYKRNLDFEKRMFAELLNQGLRRLPIPPVYDDSIILTLAGSDETWQRFVDVNLDILRDLGFVVIIDQSFRFRSIIDESEVKWLLEVDRGVDFWLALKVGISVRGETVPLMPLIMQALKRLDLEVDGPWDNESLEERLALLNDGGLFYANLQSGITLSLDFERIKLIVLTLRDLFLAQLEPNEKKKSNSQGSDPVLVTLPQVLRLTAGLTGKDQVFAPFETGALGFDLFQLPRQLPTFAENDENDEEEEEQEDLLNLDDGEKDFDVEFKRDFRDGDKKDEEDEDKKRKTDRSVFTPRFELGARLATILEKIDGFETKEIGMTPPPWFRAQLRPYQWDGFYWLNYLAEFELGGILADDMGLGKTVQSLAHIAYRKESGALQKPVLIVCPRSVLPNWQSELAKFAPELKYVVLWGEDRQSRYDQAAECDVVFTTYGVLLRDTAYIARSRLEFSGVFLDEAQAIKTSHTRIARAVGSLSCLYKVSLTGTPIENNLNELWSQFNFLLPGFLGTRRDFNRDFRRPIEALRSAKALRHLATKVRPFLLRRTKETVEKDLPPKQVILKKIPLVGTQRDLYETLRMTLYSKIKEAMEFGDSTEVSILILDAMLKLRQVCCDPRLVKLETAKRLEESAKLDLLMVMLEELLSEGRKILLFSQFTSMLDLIIEACKSRNIDFVEIRGQTIDRATPVQAFQSGKVSLFLLSLKAGGTGLNLTAADTVIHYDPWWNPAVEEQATDRAHRIGQDKPVFVYKLICANTIEDRLVTWQDRKRDLADDFYRNEGDLPKKISREDLDTFFASLNDD